MNFNIIKRKDFGLLIIGKLVSLFGLKINIRAFKKPLDFSKMEKNVTIENKSQPLGPSSLCN